MFPCFCDDKFSGVYKVTSVLFITDKGVVSEQITESEVTIKRLSKELGSYQVVSKIKIQLGPIVREFNSEIITFTNNNNNKLKGSSDLASLSVESKHNELTFILTGGFGIDLPNYGAKSIKVERLLL
jgi:hypothetical protein